LARGHGLARVELLDLTAIDVDYLVVGGQPRAVCALDDGVVGVVDVVEALR